MLAGMNPIVIAGTVFAAVAALIHVYIFVLESVQWSKESTRRIFGVRSEADADLMKPLAFNQGFYNLFLAIGVIVGVVLLVAGGAAQAGFAVAIFGLLSMVLAAAVLLASNPKLARSAAIQGVAPLAGVVLLVLGAAQSGA